MSSELCQAALRADTRRVLGAHSLFVILTLAALQYTVGIGWLAAALALSLWTVLAVCVLRALAAHPYRRFGIANLITTSRAALALLLVIGIVAADRLPAATVHHWLWTLTACMGLALVLDGIDGALARASGLCSMFGARYDMEIDALIVLLLSLLLWRLEQAGVWILAIGLQRYAFIFAGHWVGALKKPLYASRRRKVVCVMQLLCLALMLSPLLEPPLSGLVGLGSLALLSWSFARDIRWLLARASAA